MLNSAKRKEEATRSEKKEEIREYDFNKYAGGEK